MVRYTDATGGRARRIAWGTASVVIALGAVGTARAQECFPACRAGYVCHQGQCISACNPPCGAGEVCTSEATCAPAPAPVAPAPAAQPAPALPVPAPAAQSTPTPVAATPAPAEPAAPATETSLGSGVEEAAADPGFIEPPARNGPVFRFNALSILQFGIDPTLELGSSFSFFIRARLMNAGLLSYLVSADPSDDEEFVFGMGLAAGFRGYAGGRLRGMYGFYWGAALEYLHDEVEDTEDDLAVYTLDALIPQGELGYRWVWGGFAMDVGGGLGALIPVAYSAEPSEEGGCVYADSCEDDSSVGFYGLLNLGLGWFL